MTDSPPCTTIYDQLIPIASLVFTALIGMLSLWYVRRSTRAAEKQTEAAQGQLEYAREQIELAKQQFEFSRKQAFSALTVSKVLAEARFGREARKDSIYIRFTLIAGPSHPVIVNEIHVAEAGRVIAPPVDCSDMVIETVDGFKRPPLTITSEASTDIQINLFHPTNHSLLANGGEIQLRVNYQEEPVRASIPPVL